MLRTREFGSCLEAHGIPAFEAGNEGRWTGNSEKGALGGAAERTESFSAFAENLIAALDNCAKNIQIYNEGECDLRMKVLLLI